MPKSSAAPELRALLISIFFGFAINLLTAETDDWWGPLRPLTRYPWAWVPASIAAWVVWEYWRGRRSSVTWRSGNPYPGLAAFEADRAKVFFGRKQETDALLDRLAPATRLVNRRSVALVGPSGSGKSSLLQAGLFPRLGRSWRVLGPVVPGTDPFLALAQAMDDGNAVRISGRLRELAADPNKEFGSISALLTSGTRRNCVLIIDQLEDLFTQAPTSDAVGFLQLLERILVEQPSMRTVLALRPDHLGQASALAPELFRRPQPVGSLEPFFVREAIVRPAEAAGVRFEDGLVDVMVAEATVGDALPLLGLLLRRLFRTAEHGVVSYAAYVHAGRVAGAIAEQAEEVYDYLRSGPAVEDTLIRFIGYENDEPVRRQVAWIDLDDAEMVIVEEFRKARLMVDVADGMGVQFAHDAIFRQWDRLSDIVIRNKTRLQRISQFEQRAAEWSRTGSEHDLLRGETLREAERCAADLACSARLRNLLAASRTVENEFLSERADDIAAAAQNVYESDPRLATSVAAAAADEVFASTVAGLTLWGFTAVPSVSRFVVSHGSHVTGGVRLANGVLRTADRAGQVCSWDADGRLREVVRAQLGSAAHSTALDASGDYIAASFPDGGIEIHDLRTGDAVGRVDAGGSAPEITWASGGRFFTKTRSAIALWHIEENAISRMAVLPIVTNATVEWSSDGALFAVIDQDRAAIFRVDEQETFASIAVIDEAPYVKTVLWSPGDRILVVRRAVERSNWHMNLLDHGGHLVRAWRAPRLNGVLWSSTGRYLQEITSEGVSTYRDGRTGEVEMPDAVAGESFRLAGTTSASAVKPSLPAPRGWLDSSFPPSGDVSTASWDPGHVRVAAASRTGPPCVISRTSHPIFLQNGPRPTVYSERGPVRWSPDGTKIAGVDGRRVVVWDAGTGERLKIIDADAEFGDVSWSPDSRRIATARRGFAPYRRTADVFICDIASGNVVRELHPTGLLQGLVAWSPAGDTIAVVESHDLALYETTQGAQLRRWDLDKETVKSLAWSPDGSRLGVRFASAVHVIDTTSGARSTLAGRAVARFCFHRQQPWLACLYKDGVMEIWTHDFTCRMAILSVPQGHDVRDLTWGEHLIALTRDGTLLTWHMPTATGNLPQPAGLMPLTEAQRTAFGLPHGANAPPTAA